MAEILPVKKALASEFQNIAMDFLVQNVCVDRHDQIILGLTPLEDRASCIRSRDLRVGEALPYHKHDWANDASLKSKPKGLQRSDSFPISSHGNVLVVDTFQFDKGTSFEEFSQGDGGQVIKISDNVAAIILTQDSKGLKYFFGPGCTNPPTPNALDAAWILFDSRALTSSMSSVTAHLQQTLDPSTCPTHLSSAYTEFYRENIRYRADCFHNLTKPIESIVTDHFSNTSINRSGSMERMYFTRELGWTRWERWQNLDVAEEPKKAEYQRRTNALGYSGRCDIRHPAPSIGSWVLVDCREWTNLIKVSPQTEKMAAPTFWIDRLTESLTTSYFFGKK